MAQVKSENSGHITWGWVKTWVPVILVIATLLVSLGVTKQTIADHEVRMTKIELKQEKSEETLMGMRVQLAEIQRDVTYLRTEWEKQES